MIPLIECTVCGRKCPDTAKDIQNTKRRCDRSPEVRNGFMIGGYCFVTLEKGSVARKMRHHKAALRKVEEGK